jgi:hypothetical protein
MKNTESMKALVPRFCVFALVLCSLLWSVCGCSTAQPGETAAEGARRHERALAVNQQELMADLDMVLLLDKPSRLTETRVP